MIRYANGAAAQGITDIAELHRRPVPGETSPIAAWDAASRAARDVSAPMSASAERYAVRAAYQSTSLVDTEDTDTLDAVAGNALRAGWPG
ncbi:hypothetical protein [Mycobacterium servetii]|uniref:Uncharacterized protein n=1 Tax=Mycobacterium servetii TaxID=3237418 RepID=A0ABV4C837_9MYCO